MKKLLYILPALCLCASWAPAQTMETIDSVSYNPSRMGLYENLKISGGLSSAGGINASAMTVQSGGTVSIENSGNYQAVFGDVAHTLDMEDTAFNVGILYSSGTASFVGDEADSRITTMNYNNYSGVKLRLRANVLKLADVEVSGESSRSYTNAVTSGFTLGGNRIPVPASSLSCSELGWYPVLAQTGENSYQSYNVLGYGKCAGEEEEKKTLCPSTCSSGYERDPGVQYEEDGECCIKKETYYFYCTSRSSGLKVNENKYASYEEAKAACISGDDPDAFYYSKERYGTPAEYQCSNISNLQAIMSAGTGSSTRANSQMTTAVSGQWTQANTNFQVTVDRDDFDKLQNGYITVMPEWGGDITPAQLTGPILYQCTTQCAKCEGLGTGLDPCSCWAYTG